MGELTDKEIDRLCADMANDQWALEKYLGRRTELQERAERTAEDLAACETTLRDIKARMAQTRAALRGWRTGE